jgi:hypothetical protein
VPWLRMIAGVGECGDSRNDISRKEDRTSGAD